jgi:SET domain-containing protein
MMTQERWVKTKSQTLFKKFCNIHGILFKSIPYKKDERAPDYEIMINSQKIIVEVKQIDPNEEEIKKTDELREKKSVIMDTIPGGRVR